jgi:adenosylmethionine-8-amino-7-oxononanoate aminotransferase
LLAPPFICSAADISEIVGLFDRTVREVLSGLRHPAL